MKIQYFVIVVILSGLLTNPAFLVAQSQSGGDWENLNSLSAGIQLLIQQKDGRTLKGKLATVSDTSIAISKNGKIETIERSNIKAIYRSGGNSIGKTVAIGAAIGAGAGAGIGLGAVAATGGSDDVGAVIAPIILIGAGVGALLGALAGKKKRILVYEAK